jgi:hypothetical protein
MKTLEFIGPWGFPMKVRYEYYPEVLDGSRVEEPAFCGVDTVWVGGVDITQMLTNDQHVDIEQHIIAKEQA